MTFSNKTLMLIAFFFVAGFNTACSTQPTKPMSRAEKEDEADQLFRMFDANGDGFLTKAEMKQGMTYAGSFDPNSNVMLGLGSDKKRAKKNAKKLTQAEVDKAIAAAFSHDSDLDSRLSEQEFKKLVVERKPDEPDPFASIL